MAYLRHLQISLGAGRKFNVHKAFNLGLVPRGWGGGKSKVKLDLIP